MASQKIQFRDIVKAPLVSLNFPEHQYIREQTKKNQIVLHHTASGKGANGDYQTWLSNKERIATCVIIEYDGSIAQCFPTMFWGYHLGVTNDQIRAVTKHQVQLNASERLNAHSIAVEVDCWGYLKKFSGEWRAFPNNFGNSGKKVVIPESDIQFYPEGFKGYEAFEKYTPEQIETVRELLIYWHYGHGISLEYREDIWDVIPRAMKGENGIYTHNSYRKDKSDIHPQPEMITMLKNLDRAWRAGKLL